MSADRPCVAVESLESRRLLALSAAGVEFQANTFITLSQSFAAVAVDGDGDFIIAWQSYNQDGGGLGVYAKRFDAAGAVLGAEFRVNTYTSGNQSTPAIAADADGDFVVVWASNGQDGSGTGIYAQRYDAAGAPQGGEFRVNSYTTGGQGFPTVAMDPGGDIVVAWESTGQDGDNTGVYAQRYNAAGLPVGTEFQVNTHTTSAQGSATAAMGPAGDFVVAWQSSGQDGSGLGVYARLYDDSGQPLDTEFGVNTHTSFSQLSPSIAMSLEGDFVVAWTSYMQDDSSYGVYAQRYSAGGAPQGFEFQVNSFTTDTQGLPSAAMDADGDFVITYMTYSQDGDGYGVYARHYDSAGAAQGTEFEVNTHTTSNQSVPAVSMDHAGDFVVAWQSLLQDGSNYGIYAQRYDESTDTAGPLVAGVHVNGRQALPYSVQPGPVTRLIVSFSEAMSDLGGPSVTNPANWGVSHHNGTSVSDVAITSVNYLFNAATNRYEAVLQLPGSFTTGNLQVIASDAMRDVAANALDGDFDGSPGGGFSLTFSVDDPQPRGGEFLVNTHTTNIQSSAAVAMDGDGDFVVVWRSLLQDGNSNGVYAQRYNAAGVAQGAEFRVNTYTTGGQAAPAVAMNQAGDFVIAWSGAGTGDDLGVFARRYTAAGVAQGAEFKVNTHTTATQTDPSVAMSATGNFVVTWQSQLQESTEFAYGVYGQRFSAAGGLQGSEFRVNNFTPGTQQKSSVAMDATGDFVVTWESSDQDGDSFGIYARRYDSTGAAQGTEFLANSYTTNAQRQGRVSMDPQGDFVIAWHSLNQDGHDFGIFARRYNSSGVAQGTEFLVNTFTTNGQMFPWVAMDASGDFVVAWHGFAQDGISTNRVYARRFDAQGVPRGGEFRVSQFSTIAGAVASVATDAMGDFVVAWQGNSTPDNEGVYALRYAFGITPVVGALVDAPDPVTGGNPLTLTAAGVSDDGSVSSVWFYRESNGIDGLQFGSGGDLLVGKDTNAGDGWEVVASTALLAGTYIYYAQAVDNEGFVGPAASASSTLVAPPGPLVIAAEFLYETAPQKLTFRFDRNVSGNDPGDISAADISVVNLAGGPPLAVTMLSYDTNTNTATFSIDALLADGNYRATISAAGVTDGGNPMAADYVFNFFILGGDANHDRRVDVADLVIFANNYLGTGKTWSQADFNLDGVVNKVDLGPMALNWHQTLAQPAPALPAAPVSARPAARAPIRPPTRVIDLVQ